MIQVGRIKKVNLRDVWKHEAKDFTPWLLENPDVLGDALNLEVEFSQSEQQVGPYAVDIIGKDLTHDSVLIVENQLEKSNHDHLGKLVTYLASVGAGKATWVVSEPREEHKKAISWLNDSTSAEFYLFKIEGIKILIKYNFHIIFIPKRFNRFKS